MKTEKAMSSFSRNRSQGFLFTLSAIADQFREAFDKKLVIFLVVAGILIHGEMAFNKLTWFDDVTATVYQGFSVQTGLRHGRWFYSILLKLLKTFFLNNSIPVIICLISFFFMALYKNTYSCKRIKKDCIFAETQEGYYTIRYSFIYYDVGRKSTFCP